MIEFGDFYQHIAKSPLSHWLDTLPAQLSAWQRESLHGKFKQWFNSVEHLPTLTPTRLDLLHGVRAEMEPGLSPGQLGPSLSAESGFLAINTCSMAKKSG